MSPKTKKKTIKKIKKLKKQFYYAVGRRKSATAQIRLWQGKGKILVNNLPIEQYFPGSINEKIYLEPLRTTNNLDKFHATIKVSGSGKNAQLIAVVHGLSRALAKVDDSYQKILKSRDFLTRDDRMKERRKPGLAQAARAAKQSPRR